MNPPAPPPTRSTLWRASSRARESASQNLFYRFQLAHFRCRENFANNFRNVVKSNAALQKSRHRHLVGRVECNRFRAPGLRRFVGQAQTREFFHIRRQEFEMS